jgi:hypothetical protein
MLSYELYQIGGLGFWTLLSMLPSYFIMVGGWYFTYKLEDRQRIKKLHITRDSRQPDHLISHILSHMEKNDCDQSCYDCLVVRPLHAEHCTRCDACVRFRHKHSQLMGICIGHGNQLAYFEFIGCVINILFTHVAAIVITMTPDVSNPMFKVIAFAQAVVDQNQYWILFLVVLALYFVLEFTDSIFTMGAAVARGVTCAEFNNAWMHKHLFRMRMTPTDRTGESRAYYAFREMALWQMMKNFGNFMFARPIVQIEEYGHRQTRVPTTEVEMTTV